MGISFLEAPRQVTFDWHASQVIKWLKFDNGRHLDSVLVYASFELRCAIERYIFELLVLLKGCKLTKEDEKKCRSIKGLFALMQETDPYYRRTVEFSKLIFSVTPGAPEITIVDTSYLRRMWEELSNYCHKQLIPDKSFNSPDGSFKEKGFKTINEILAKFRKWKFESAVGVIQVDTMPPETKEIYEKFVRNEITADQAKRMLDLMLPVLNRRMHNKK